MAAKNPNKSTMPWGHTKVFCWLLLTHKRRWIVGTMAASVIRLATNGASVSDTPTDKSKVIRPAPHSPPTLNWAWKLDIKERFSWASTATPWRFMATSMVPSEAPKRNRAVASIKGVWAMAKAGRKTTSPKPPSNTMDLGPCRAATNPAIGIAISDPTPKQSKRRPNWRSSAATFCFINGNKGAQEAIANPAAKNASLVASRAWAVEANLRIKGPILIKPSQQKITQTAR